MKMTWLLGAVLFALAALAVSAPVATAAAPSVAQHVICSTQTTNPIVCALPQSVTSGQLIYVATRYNASLSVKGVTDNCSAGADSYTQDPQSPQRAPDFSTGLSVYYASGVRGGTCSVSVSYSGAPNPGSVELIVLNGVAASGSWDGSAGATFTTATATPSSGSVSTTTGNDVLVEAVALMSADTYTPTGSYALIDTDPLWKRMAIAAEVTTATGSYASGWTLKTATTGAAMLTAFKGSGAPTQANTGELQLLWDDGTSVAGTATLYQEGTTETKVDSKALDSTGTVTTSAAIDPTKSYKLSVVDPTGASLGQELTAPLPSTLSSGVLAIMSSNKLVVTLRKADRSVASAKLAPQ
jgi:hypothetical protein